MKNFGTLIGLALLICLVLTGCGGGGGGYTTSSSSSSSPTLTTITVASSGGSSVAVGSTLQLSSQGTYSDHTTATLTAQTTWASSDPSVATVNALGLVTGVKAGTATISAKMGTVTGTMSITVTAVAPSLSRINVTASTSSLAAGATLQLTAQGVYSDSSTANITSQVTWTSSDTTVATVNASGVVTGVRAGMPTISATMGTVTGNMNITVTAVSGSLSSISVTAPASSLATGATLQLTAQGVYSDGSTQLITSQVTWHSSNTAVATISSAGLLSGVSAGPVTVTATQGSVTGQIAITVSPATLSSISVVPAAFSIASGQTKQLSVQGFFTDGSSQDVTAQVTWGSSDTNFATVNATGLVKGIATGSATINATLGSLTAPSTATITAAALNSITVTPSSASVAIGQTQAFTASGVFSDGSSTDITNSVVWSSTTNTATVDQTGLAKGIAAGSATIQATSGSVTGSAPLTITAAVLTGIDITPDEQSVPVGGQLPLFLTGNYSDGTSQPLTNGSWSSSNTALATVDPSTGVVIGVADSGVNPVIINVYAGGFADSTTVYVTPAVIESIALSPATASIAKGTTQQFTVNATFNDGSIQQLMEGLTWSPSAPDVAGVNGTGLATGLLPGDTTITVTYGTFTGTAHLTVTPATLLSIELTPGAPRVGINGNVQFTATGVFSDNSTQDLTSAATWSSSNAAVALVDAAGVATGMTNGTATITASYGGVNGTTTITVTTATLRSITISPASPIVPPRTKIQMTAIGVFSDGSQIPLSGVTWSTSTGRYMSVSGSGVVRTKRVKNNGVPLYARYHGITGQTNITITNETLRSLVITPANPTIAVGTQLQFKLIGTFSDGVTTVDLTKSAYWQTDHYQLAVINNSGIVSGMAPGSVTITGTYKGMNPATTTLTVSNATIQSVAVTPTPASIVLGDPQHQQQQFTATGTFSDSSTQDITTVSTWTSSSPSVALVNSTGLATGATPGQTNINATFKGAATESKVGSAVLTVN